MELELKLEWLEGVSKNLGGASPPDFFDTPSSNSNFNSNSIEKANGNWRKKNGAKIGVRRKNQQLTTWNCRNNIFKNITNIYSFSVRYVSGGCVMFVSSMEPSDRLRQGPNQPFEHLENNVMSVSNTFLNIYFSKSEQKLADFSTEFRPYKLAFFPIFSGVLCTATKHRKKCFKTYV